MNYLYNGKSLPDINTVWTDKNAYPYAVMFFLASADDWTTPVYILFLLNQPATIGIARRFISGGGSVACYKIVGNEEKWKSSFTTDTAHGDMISGDSFISAGSTGWSNYDVLETDGTLYLAASDPIPVSAPQLDPLSLFTGWKAGNWVARQRGKKVEEEKTPVAYLYNGVILPDINAVWTDKEKYPYAIIAGYTIDASETDGAGEIVFAALLLYKNAAEQGSDTSEHLIVGQHAQYKATNNQEVADIYGISELNAWCLHGKDDSEDAAMSADAATWTSHDILNADGSVYLAASDPVPVYE